MNVSSKRFSYVLCPFSQRKPMPQLENGYIYCFQIKNYAFTPAFTHTILPPKICIVLTPEEFVPSKSLRKTADKLSVGPVYEIPMVLVTPSQGPGKMLLGELRNALSPLEAQQIILLTDLVKTVKHVSLISFSTK